MVYYTEEVDSLIVQLFTAVMILVSALVLFINTDMKLLNILSYIPIVTHIGSIITAIGIYTSVTPTSGFILWISTWTLIAIKDAVHGIIIAIFGIRMMSIGFDRIVQVYKIYTILIIMVILTELVVSVLAGVDLFIKGDLVQYSYTDLLSRDFISVQHWMKCFAEAVNVWIFYTFTKNNNKNALMATMRDRGLRFQIFSILMTVAWAINLEMPYQNQPMARLGLNWTIDTMTYFAAIAQFGGKVSDVESSFNKKSNLKSAPISGFTSTTTDKSVNEKVQKVVRQRSISSTKE
ncbi:hypothetical protein HDV06_001488 [Boothiomyces sp. JEL0866]|nr:hypothetical protein HDV06_001488 [Boothiomyces sp. JEL0866]